MAKKRNIESASVFERSGIRAIRARIIEVLLYYIEGLVDAHFKSSWMRTYDYFYVHMNYRISQWNWNKGARINLFFYVSLF